MCFFPRSRIDLKFELLKYLLQFGRLYNLSCRQSKWWWWGPVLRIDVEPPSTILQADFFFIPAYDKNLWQAGTDPICI